MNYTDYAQQDSFIGEYMRFMAAQETPLAYDFWCACWALSCAIGRRHPVLRPRAPVYMNMYMLLIGDSGVTRKSTSVNTATRVVRSFVDDHDERVAILDGRVTPAALVRTMVNLNNGGSGANVCLSVSELAATFGRSGSAGELSIMLTDLYDCPTFRRGGSEAAGQWEVRDAYLSFIGASTVAWLQRAVTPNVIEGGFTSRCIFVNSDKRKQKVAWPMEGQNNETGIADLRQSLRRRRTEMDARGRDGIPATEAAIRRFSSWYNSRRIGTDIFRSSYDGRADAHVLRVAGILSVSDTSYTIHDRHIEQAIDLVEGSRAAGAGLFAGTSTNAVPTHVRAFTRLRDTLVAGGREGVTQSRITLALAHYADSAIVMRMLEAMHDMDMVQRAVLMPSNKGGRKRTVWRATKLIFSKSAEDIANYLANPAAVHTTKEIDDGPD